MPPAGFRLTVYARDRWYEACPILRVTGPASAAGFEVIPGYDWSTGTIRIDPSLVDASSAVLICRDFPRYSNECLQIITRAHRQGIPLIYETDDILFEMPVEHPDYIHYQAAAPMILFTILEADLVITSTAYLKDKLVPFHQDIQVVPNLLNDSLWKIKTQPPNPPETAWLVIGYFGTHTHRRDLEMILPALESCLNRMGDTVLLKIWGGCLPPQLAAHPRVELVSEGIFDYAAFAEHIQSQHVDLWIAPLADTPFNRAKSAIKFLEYSATGTPGIYSRIDPYEAVIHDGENGYLASSQEEWTVCLERLLSDAALRRQMGQRSLETVRANWLLSQKHTHFSAATQSSRCRKAGVEFYTPPQATAAFHELAAGNLPVLERLDRLSYLERALSENQVGGVENLNDAEGLFQLLRSAQQYGAARDAELAAVRSSTTYRLARVLGKPVRAASRLANWAHGIIPHPSKEKHAD